MKTISLLLLSACVAFPVFAFDKSAADRFARGEVCEVSVPHAFPEGRIDWLFNPTSAKGPFNPEWTWQLNRMSFWKTLADAYAETRDERYAQAFARQLEGWLDQCGTPPEKGYNGVGSPWRTIEEGLRLMGSWHVAWRAFAPSPAFTPALKERFKASALAQARHLLKHRSGVGNWLLMEMNGVYTFASDFPELPESATMRKESAAALAEAIRAQILPDGMQYELSPDYHSVAIACAAQLYARARETGFENELPPYFRGQLEKMAESVVALTTPALVQPRFNDCFTMHADKMVGRLAPFFTNRADFAWVVSRRAEGRAPEGATASRFLPWAGFAAMRSGWDADATYLCFDVGPLGMAHFHHDKLTFTFWKGDQELVCDDGGGQYDDSQERVYAVNGFDHNVLAVDGLVQCRDQPRRVDKPIEAGWTTTPLRDSAYGVYDQGFGPGMLKLATHMRQIVFDKVADSVTVTDDVASADGAEHAYALLFQLDTTNVVVSAEGTALRARFGRKWDLALKVVEGGTIRTATGQRTPALAGWFVGRNDLTVHPATTVFVSAPRCKDRRFIITLKAVPAGKE